LAQRIGPELAITGTVQKVSNNSTEPAPSVATGKAEIVRDGWAIWPLDSKGMI